MDRHEWRRERFGDAVGQLTDRSSQQDRGVADLILLEELAARFGHGLDARLESGFGETYGTFPGLMDAVDPDGDIGVVARKRIDGAHNVNLAGALCGIESLVFGDVQPPAGVKVTSWTKTTSLRRGTPGVAVIDNDVKTRTVLIMSVVGGEHNQAYNLPIWIEPAYDPTNIRALALQAIRLAVCGRALVRHYAPEVAGVRIGSLPILLGRIRAAGPHPILGGIFSEPVAFADLPEVVDELARLTEQGVPFVAQACYGSDGRLAVPENWYLDITPAADADAERPTGLSGLGEKRRNDIVPMLLGKPDAVRDGLIERVPDTEGNTWLAKGCMLSLGLRGIVPMGAVGYISLEGQPTIALTNLPRTPPGMLRLSMAIEGLAGSAKARARCRRRLARFVGHIDVPTDSRSAARRVFGVLVMSYRWTVIERVTGSRGIRLS